MPWTFRAHRVPGLKGQSNKRLISMNEVKQNREGDSMWAILKGRMYNISPYMRFHPGGGTFSLYTLLCRHAKIKTIPNQHQTDEELTTYSHSTFHEQSYVAKTKKWLELLQVLFTLLPGFKFILKCVRYLLLTLTLDMRILLTLR